MAASPRVDDHLVEPEVTRDEIIDGRRVVAMPGEAPHAIWHGNLQYVLRAHVVPGYSGAVDLLTRQGEKSDFASESRSMRRSESKSCSVLTSIG